ncbi:MAG: 16S rRNA (adenine(1518)-N(6)/adenine(1519)-N(6))-dimethyltransferase RsmA [Actinomycetia bacterium]|nr:16S rRNA (adenine(1518)-N(6)/adenine(1519)-N(6))-dimethyltransferase RsmA [Actinomycetes bacterium]
MGSSSAQSRREILQLLDEAGHRPNKHFGQNFLVDPNVVDRIVAVAELERSSQVVEVGAGTGTLTRALAEVAGTVVAYEIDGSLAEVLNETTDGFGNVDVRISDAAKLDLDVSLGDGSWSMVANLPYNVGTGIVLDAVRCAPRIGRFVVMVQKEVADRLVAGPGSKTYGIPSVIAGLHVRSRIVFTVPPEVFEPRPTIESAVVVMDRINSPALAGRAIELASAAFGQRRKMIRGSLKSVLGDPLPIIEAASLEPTARAETLSPLDFVALAEAEAGR